MELVKAIPSKYRAIRFDKKFADKYGLIKYPMLRSFKHLTYLDNHSYVITSREYTFVKLVFSHPDSDPWDENIISFDRAEGRAEVRLSDGHIGSVGVPWKKTKTVWEKHKFLFIPYERKVTKPVYDFDAPELSAFVIKYFCGSDEVHDGDLIVTDQEGRSQVYSPDKFNDKFDVVSEDE